jgi:hypothetical protein
MKKAILILATTVGLLSTECVHAQGTLYVSNLEQTPTGNMPVGSDAWVAQTFNTGTNSDGYVLNSIRLLMVAASGSPSGFAVSIYSKTGDPHGLNFASDSPESSLGSLAGSDPAAGGLYTYNTSGITLSSSTFYFVVLTAATPVANGTYDWSAVNRPTQSIERWGIENVYYSSVNGSTWEAQARQSVFQLGIYGTPIPEPGASALIALGLAGLAFWRHKIGQVK